MNHLAFATAALAAVLSGCARDAASSLTQRFPAQAGHILAGPGWIGAQGALVPAPIAAPADPVKAAEASLARRTALELRLPADGGDAAVFSAGGLRVEVRERGLAGPAASTRGAVSYSRPGLTSWWTTSGDGYEEWLEVDSVGDGPVATWDVAGATLRQAGDGVELLDGSGMTVARVTAPRAYEMGGNEKRAWLRAEGGAIALYTDARGTALVDPLWTTPASLVSARDRHTATLLSTGKVLVAGGWSGDSALAYAELYDPATGSWTATGSLSTARSWHTATMLPSGKVLVAGGTGGGAITSSAELYDPVTGSWSTTGPLAGARYGQTATLLLSGKVLVAGGFDGSSLSSAELYDPSSGTWSLAAPLAVPRGYHTATMLFTGEVLVAGGFSGFGSVDAAELYDPVNGTWSAVAPLPGARYWHTATALPNGRVLVVGGYDYANGLNVATAALFDPWTDTWSATGSLATARRQQSASLLPSGKLLVAGGIGAAGTLGSAELYDPAAGTWSSGGALGMVRYGHTSTLLPTGKLLFAGGWGGGGAYLSSAELYDPASASWGASSPLATARWRFTATLLSSGKVLVAGGLGAGGLSIAELYDPALGTWSPTGSLQTARYDHTATLLPTGKVLVVGGYNGAHLSSAELYDPDAGTWSPTGAMGIARAWHTATLLASGKVLVAGGERLLGTLAAAELYDPEGGTWSATGPLATARDGHTATLLASGKVIVVGGGHSTASPLSSAEAYDPTSGSWSAAGSLATARYQHTASLLPTGKVIVVGGGGTGALASAELYDPESNGWSATGSLGAARQSHTATVLGSGELLVAGGYAVTPGHLATTELYDPAAGTWRSGATMATARSSHLATLLLSGKVLAVGGYGPAGRMAAAELYDEGRGAPLSSGPTFHSRPPVPVVLGRTLRLTGDFSAPHYPLLHLTRAGSDSGAFLPLSYFSCDLFGNCTLQAPLPVSLLPGLYWARAIQNGVPGVAIPLRLIANSPPVAQPKSVTLDEDGWAYFGLVATDVDGDALTFTVVTPPTHGALTGSGASRTYTPDADYHGTDTFTFVAGDGLADSGPATVSLTVTPVNDAPVAQPQSAAMDEDAVLAITLAATDVEGDPLTWAVSTQPVHGTVALSGATATYTPAANYHGPDGFTFWAIDGAAYSTAATVTLAIAPVNDAPVAQEQSVSTLEEVAITLTLGGSDADGDALTYSVVTQPSNGTLSGTGASLTYTPAPDFNGNDSFTFRVNDGTADSAPATASIAVAPVAEPAPSDPKGGCSCGTSGELAPFGGLLLGLLAFRRRRRAT